jgi:flagellar biosynthetic protein FliO
MDLIGQMAAVAGVLGLLALTLWGLRRRGLAALLLPRRGGRQVIENLERLPLGPQHTLHLIRLGEEVLLVACSPGGCTVIANRPWREPVPAGGPPS